ncbi:MAG: hypothetical protein ACOVQ4_21930, partial [Flectobacillus sp.]|uniref:hypothetical protein n=1 Tax=Flectobacillus sp. TaxID=50419 RepID=UPI003B9AFB48
LLMVSQQGDESIKRWWIWNFRNLAVFLTFSFLDECVARQGYLCISEFCCRELVSGTLTTDGKQF